MFVLAHLSDPHLGPLPPARLGELAGKRVLGYANWRRRRHVDHRTEVLDALVDDLKARTPDHIAVTGDLVNIALDDEFVPARRWLMRLGSPHDVSVVPGNHDAYVRGAAQHPARHWGDYMRGDGVGTAAPPDRPVQFPYVRRRGPIALVGLSTAVPTAPFMATGTLGAEQLMRLSEILAHLRHERAFRVVLIHHPPNPGPSDRFKWLVDAGPFRRAVADHGAELILHGHHHVHALGTIAGPAAPVPVVGVPSASQARSGDRDPAAYNLYSVTGSAGAWRCEMVSRGFTRAHDGVVEIVRRSLIG